jgi:5-methylcytosine-specific restriction enzyme B
LSNEFVIHNLVYPEWQLATFYTALQTKGFVILSGISGTGKTRLAQAFAGMLPQPAEGANHLFVTVRPDWRDSKSLLGYYNPLTGAYEWTPFLRFLLRAEQNYKSEDKLAWFVILDEMNLAHVEYYFADLLSVLESGRDEDGWTREPVRLGYPDEAAGDLPPRERKLPPNLYIVGTVNVDETTHAFSPKVLDRAFTLELTDVDFTTYPIPSASTQLGPSDQERKAILKDFARNDRFARVEKPTIMAYVTTHPKIRDRLQTLNDVLSPHDLHFAYRVFDEIVTFLAAAESNKLYDDLDGAEAAFDAAVLMKVLPKFHGSRGRLERPLCAVLAWCVNPGTPNVKAIEDALQEVGPDKTVKQAVLSFQFLYPRTAERVQRMLARLYTDGFAAFG